MRPSSRALLAPVVLMAGMLLAACASAPPPRAQGAATIDLPRFMGTWYVVARIPNVIERGHVGGRDDYTLRPNGDIAVRYAYRTGFGEPWKSLDFSASVRAGTGNREWRVRFFRVVPTTQRILEVAPDYSWALIDVPGRDLAWIFSRTPVIDDALYLDLRKRMRGHGIDIDKVWRVAQTQAQVGQPGVDAPKAP